MTKLDAWLRRKPQPAAVLADGRRVAVPDSPRRWAELAETLDALGASRLVAIDDQGVTLRAVSLESGGELQEQAAAPKSPLASELTVMSSLLADAYRTGAETAMGAMRGSIEENTKLVRLLADRLSAIEVAWQRSLATHARLTTELAHAQAAATTGAADDGVLGALLPLIAAGAPAPAPKKAG